MSDARIVGRGFQHYHGPRLGSAYAVRAMIWASLRRGVGARRPAISTLLPGILMVSTYAVVFVTMSTARAQGTETIFYRSVYGSLSLIFTIFAGVVAPTLVCSDRRERVISLYFAAPITRTDYIGAQFTALSLLLVLLTLVPMVFLFVVYMALSPAAGTYLYDHLGDLGHVILSGGLLAVYYSALALALAAGTDRQSYATGIYLGLMLVSYAAGGILSQSLTFAGHEHYALLDLVNLPARAVRWLFGRQSGPDYTVDATPDLGAAYMVATLSVLAVSLGSVVWQYGRVQD